MASEITRQNATRVFYQHFFDLVYNTQPPDIPYLRRSIVEKSERITAERFQNVREQFEVRNYHCHSNIGVHFELSRR